MSYILFSCSILLCFTFILRSHVLNGSLKYCVFKEKCLTQYCICFPFLLFFFSYLLHFFNTSVRHIVHWLSYQFVTYYLLSEVRYSLRSLGCTIRKLRPKEYWSVPGTVESVVEEPIKLHTRKLKNVLKLHNSNSNMLEQASSKSGTSATCGICTFVALWTSSTNLLWHTSQK